MESVLEAGQLGAVGGYCAAAVGTVAAGDVDSLAVRREGLKDGGLDLGVLLAKGRGGLGLCARLGGRKFRVVLQFAPPFYLAGPPRKRGPRNPLPGVSMCAECR
ncbi:hypothetical protein SBA4_4300004 [Candidatus Sulfopaludibacter sp. SbA4]|nr:hypothetical protein SBA4_4300004 [Candidatus Sulfopaludibacter sp. SbA4]